MKAFGNVLFAFGILLVLGSVMAPFITLASLPQAWCDALGSAMECPDGKSPKCMSVGTGGKGTTPRAYCGEAQRSMGPVYLALTGMIVGGIVVGVASVAFGTRLSHDPKDTATIAPSPRGDGGA
jgi:hypothetical protein